MAIPPDPLDTSVSLCEYPRCVDGERPAYCGNCCARPMRSDAPSRSWVVYRTQTLTDVYTGICAVGREQALEAFYRGEGERQADRQRTSEWHLDAVDVRPPE